MQFLMRIRITRQMQRMHRQIIVGLRFGNGRQDRHRFAARARAGEREAEPALINCVVRRELRRAARGFQRVQVAAALRLDARELMPRRVIVGMRVEPRAQACHRLVEATGARQRIDSVRCSGIVNDVQRGQIPLKNLS